LDQESAKIQLSAAYGELALCELRLGSVGTVSKAAVAIEGNPVAARWSAEKGYWKVLFEEPLLIKTGQKLRIDCFR
jgi:hypothetical protein